MINFEETKAYKRMPSDYRYRQLAGHFVSVNPSNIIIHHASAHRDQSSGLWTIDDIEFSLLHFPTRFILKRHNDITTLEVVA